MKAKRIIAIVLAIYGLVFWPLPAHATPITIQIEAVVDSVQDHGNYLEGQINPGDVITGWYTYESTTPDSNPTNPIVGDYYHYSPPSGVSLTVGSFEFKTDPTNIYFHIGVENHEPSGNDSYWFSSNNNVPLSNGTLVDGITWQLDDPTGNALSSDALPTTAPFLEDWQ
ncbi:MAG: hypothetical protein WAK60_07970 [Sedimentisphaerales bacterium]